MVSKMNIHSRWMSFSLFRFRWPFSPTLKRSIPGFFFSFFLRLSLPLFIASRSHDLFGGCLNRLAFIKSYAPLMTLSWARALVLWGKGIGMKIDWGAGCSGVAKKRVNYGQKLWYMCLVKGDLFWGIKPEEWKRKNSGNRVIEGDAHRG